MDLLDGACQQLILSFFIVFIIALFIINNGNILTDGTDGKKYLQRKYNEL